MSKLLVYILDKVVWMLLITVLTTQALQIAGVLQSPKSLSDITYTQENNYEFKLSAEDIDSSRAKRQTGERSAVLDGIFNRHREPGDYIYRLDRTKVITAKI